jgi:hypothetical protein
MKSIMRNETGPPSLEKFRLEVIMQIVIPDSYVRSGLVGGADPIYAVLNCRGAATTQVWPTLGRQDGRPNIVRMSEFVKGVRKWKIFLFCFVSCFITSFFPI